MTLLQHALQGGLAPTRPDGPAAAARRVLVLGAGGPLGSAVMEQLLGSSSWAGVATLVTQPMAVALRGMEAWPVAEGFLDATPQLPWAPDSAVLVFDRERGAHLAVAARAGAARRGRPARPAREAALWRPDPATLTALGRWLRAAGVRQLLVVLPHAPGLLPQALRAGLATLDEAALAALGFEHLVFVRPARDGGSTAAAGSALQRLGQNLLRQMQWMVPQRQQALRPARVAAFVAALARALPQVPPGTRVVAPELLWDWAQPGGGAPVLDAWLHGRTLPPVAAGARRW
ncbi:hypothetical protein AACH10_23535 [Ideonella sp. DXS22W]|uniref:Uncharacterized protein n=1 Tax=Pseudaquabacterium inlustre TaxID=2984192 RepID=A0ABU9CN47_9BURK